MNLDEIPFHMLDDQTQRLKRMEKYAEILAIKKMGITLTKSYDINSDYDCNYGYKLLIIVLKKMLLQWLCSLRLHMCLRISLVTKISWLLV